MTETKAPYQPPDEEIVVSGEEIPFANAIAATSTEPFASAEAFAASSGNLNVTVDSGDTPAGDSKLSAQKMVTVVAPSTLSGGYTFPASVDGKHFTVTVPVEGVKEGQHFEVPYPMEEEMVTIPLSSSSAMVTTTGGSLPMASVSAVKGRWKYGLCDCCSTFCNGLFWMGCCCNGFLFAQLLQRMHRDEFGGPSINWKHTCRNVCIAFVLYIALQFTGIGEAVSVIYLVYTLIMGTRLRYFFRKHYDIKPSCCECMDGQMDDCCCTFWCSCCMNIQMARHTHDEDQYPYRCFTPTGLPRNAPECV